VYQREQTHECKVYYDFINGRHAALVVFGKFLKYLDAGKPLPSKLVDLLHYFSVKVMEGIKSAADVQALRMGMEEKARRKRRQETAPSSSVPTSKSRRASRQ